jgi:hypothetical protein
MSPDQSKYYRASFRHVALPLQSNVRRIYDYEGEDSIPAPLTSPLTADELAPYIDQDMLVTFTVRVPLDIVAAGGDALYEFITSMAFAEPASLHNFEFRAVGASFDRFDEKLSGQVHLQVTGDISAEIE